MALAEELAKLCLYKVRQLKILQRGGDVEKLNHSLDREQQFVLTIESGQTLGDFELALYNTYRLLEKKLLEELAKDQKDTLCRLAEFRISGALQRKQLP